MTPSESRPSEGGVDVVVVTYRTGPVLFDCLDAVLAEPALARLVVVDNGNDDDVERRLDSLASSPQVEVLRDHGNVGFARACNLGVARGSAPAVLLINPDCVLSPGTLGAAADRLMAQTEAGALGVRITNEDGTEQRGGRRNDLTPWTLLSDALRLYRFGARPWTLEHLPAPSAAQDIPCISGSFMLVRRAAYEAIGGMDERYFLHVEDVDFCRRLWAAGWRIRYEPDLSVRHVGGTSEVTPLFVEARKTDSAALYFRTHFPGGAVSGLSDLLGVLWRELVIMAVRARYAALVIRGALKGGRSARTPSNGGR